MNMTNDIPELWKIALKGAKYLVRNCEFDYDSCAMDEFLRTIGCDTNDMTFMDWFFDNISKQLY